MFDGWFADLRSSSRGLRQHPGFAVTAVLVVALGLGLTTAMFGIVNSVLLRPLPYGEPDRLVVVWQDLRTRALPRFTFSTADYADLLQQVPAFEGAAAVTSARQPMIGDDGTPEMVRTSSATVNVFSVLRVPMFLGRTFEDRDAVPEKSPGDEGRAPGSGAPAAAIISHAFWQRHFGGDPHAIGRVLRLGRGAEVVGVLPAGFQFLLPRVADIDADPDVWLAMRADFMAGERNLAPLRVVARLGPTASLPQAQQQTDALAADLRSRFPIKATSNLHIWVAPMFDDLVGPVRPALAALMGAVVFVLLIACANVAGLVLARSGRRTGELAVRSALGASRSSLVRHLLAESLLVSSAGALLGLGIAEAALQVFRVVGPRDLPRLDAVSLDGRVLLFALVMTAVTTVAVGLVPAWQLSRLSVMGVLRQTGRSMASARHPFRSALIVAEVALSFVLLVGAGLMVRSFVALQRTDPGFNADGVYTFLLPPPTDTTPESRQARMDALRARLAAVPGVAAVTATSGLPLDGTAMNGPYGPLSARADANLMRQAYLRYVLPGYFAAMQTPVIDGREFEEADNRPGVNRVVIDEVLASKLFPGESAVGRQMLVPRVAGVIQQEPFEIIGVTRAQHNVTLEAPGRETVFIADGRAGSGVARRWAIRAAGVDASLPGAVKRALADVDPTLPLADGQPMRAFVAAAAAPTRFSLLLMSVFGLMAATLTVVGLYGVLSTLVSERAAEIAVRMSLGADRLSIFRLVIGHGLALSLIGLAVGLGLSVWLTGLMKTMVIGVSPVDPPTFAFAAAAFLAVVAVASALPANRASRMAPVEALRS